MVSNHYSTQPKNPAKSSMARGVDLRVHFKNTRETAAAIKGMTLTRAKSYLHHVIQKKEIVPFRRYSGKVGLKAQVKAFHKATQGRWPKKSCEYILNVLKNAEANAKHKQLDTDRLFISHIAVQLAVKRHRRTYGAHGRIGPYMCNPCHIEVILTEKAKQVKKPEESK